ncbi:MAG: ribonuclease J [Rhodospirillales bacterium]|nr:ribonuclease J [Rhodospirillales bacterium]
MNVVTRRPELVFLPLGGAGEIGMNLNLYGYGVEGEHEWLMLDLGIAFGDDAHPGIDVVMPDPQFIVARRDRLLGLILTHAHEDHLGAVIHLWPQLGCPVYGTPFALGLLKRKLPETGLVGRVPLLPLPTQGELVLGPFRLGFVGLTHSIPEMQAVIIRTPAGTVLHSGDWKFDPDPVVGETSDEAALARLGREGVLALVCDSTNVFEAGHSGSEGALLPTLTEMIGRCTARAVVTCFASNIARIVTIARAAAANGRRVTLTGSSLKRTTAVAEECGYLRDIEPFIDERTAQAMPRDAIVIVTTGGQGEPNAALMKLAAEEHPALTLDPGDTVIFSSRVIPGNEASIGRLQNRLLRRGVEIVTHRHGHVHVSGHPARDELIRMYQLVRPRIAVPVHGELRHLIEHARLAEEQQVSETIIAENGTLVRLAPDPAIAIGTTPAGRLAVDGSRLVPVDAEMLRERTRALFNGTCLVTVTLSRRRKLGDVHLTAVGLLVDDDDETLDAVEDAVRKAVDELGAASYNDDAVVRETVRLAVRRIFRQILNKRPVTHVHLVRM